MTNLKEILVVEDNYEICEMMRDILGEQGYNVTTAGNTKSALEAIEKVRPHLIILDIWLEGNHLDGIGLLKKMRQMFSDVPIIMISGHANVELAASTIRFGAYDFIEKPFKTEKLLIVVKRALEAKELVEINSYLQTNNSSVFKISNGVSKSALKLRSDIKSLATSNCRFIISGEIGSQTAYVAKEIHDQSSRSQKPFITLSSFVNSDYEKISRIIFGTERDKSIFERANGGTVVLENLHELPYIVQTKLLEALQKEGITRNNKLIKFDVRVVATFELSSNTDVSNLVKNRSLNEMLYHRLNVKNMVVPPLRTRVDDIASLFVLSAKSYANTPGEINIEMIKRALISYTWPCNTQELCNIAEYAVMMMKIQNDNTLNASMLNPNILGTMKTDFASFASISEYLDKDYKSAKRHFDIEYIKAQLRRFSNNVAKTARFMGVDRAALYRKIRSLFVIPKSGNNKIVSLIHNETSHLTQDDEAIM